MEEKSAVTALAALAQESRLAIFRLLVEAGPDGLAVGSIGAALAIAPATLSFHLKELFNAGLIQALQQGRFVIYSLGGLRRDEWPHRLFDRELLQGQRPDLCNTVRAASRGR